MTSERSWRVTMPGPGEEDLDLLLTVEQVFERDGFGQIPYLYPVTIVQARYNGSYEGRSWLAFPVRPHELNHGSSPWNEWNGDDIECMQWWDAVIAKQVPIGRSGTPDGALNSLLEQVATAAGVDLDSLVQLPTWNRDELHRRMQDG